VLPKLEGGGIAASFLSCNSEALIENITNINVNFDKNIEIGNKMCYNENAKLYQIHKLRKTHG